MKNLIGLSNKAINFQKFLNLSQDLQLAKDYNNNNRVTLEITQDLSKPKLKVTKTLIRCLKYKILQEMACNLCTQHNQMLLRFNKTIKMVLAHKMGKNGNYHHNSEVTTTFKATRHH